MIPTEDEVKATIYRILDSAQASSWEIELMTPNLTMKSGSIQIRGQKPLKIITHEELELVMEAWERMISELFYVRHKNGVVWRVTEEGRAALEDFRAKQKASGKKWNLVGLSYSTDDTEAIERYCRSVDAHVMIVNNPVFKDNVGQIVQMFKDFGCDGFTIANAADFKSEAVSNLYYQAKLNNLYVFEAARGRAPLSDSDVVSQDKAKLPISQIVNINVQGDQNTIATHGSINSQIRNNLEIVYQTNPDIAAVIKEFAAAAQRPELPPEQSAQLLSRLDTLANEIAKKPVKSQFWSVMERGKGVVDYVETVMKVNAAAHFLSAHAATLMPLITAAFGGS